MPWQSGIQDQILVPPDGPPDIVIGLVVPAELIAFYGPTGIGETPVAVIMFRRTVDNYVYFLLTSNGIEPILNIGTCNLGVVYHGMRWLLNTFTDWDIKIGGLSPGLSLILEMFNPGALVLDQGVSWKIDNTEQPRGFMTGKSSAAAPVQSVASTTEVVVFTTDSETLINGRAYDWELKGFHKSGTAQDVRYRVRINDGSSPPTGTIVADFGDIPIVSTASGGENIYSRRSIRNVSGGTVTHSYVLTMALLAGAANADFTSRNSSPCELNLWDIGTSTQFPNAKAVT